MRRPELLKMRPCPFCGNPNVEVVRYKADGVRLFRDRYAVLCRHDPGCGSESGHWHSPEEAVYMWNQRKRRWKNAD